MDEGSTESRSRQRKKEKKKKTKHQVNKQCKRGLSGEKGSEKMTERSIEMTRAVYRYLLPNKLSGSQISLHLFSSSLFSNMGSKEQSLYVLGGHRLWRHS